MTERRLDTELQQFGNVRTTEALQAGERLCLAKGVYQNISTDVQNTTIAS